MATVKDPVCGMTLEDSEAPERADYNSTIYCFCSTSCREEFEANPEDYAG